MHGNLWNLGDWEFALRPVRAGHDVADAGPYMRQRDVVVIDVVHAIRLGLHGCQGWRVVEGQVADGGQLEVAGPKWPQAW